MSYAEQIQAPAWQKKRLEILNRDKWTCQLCGDTKTTFHIHHKEYKKGVEIWDYPDDNFQTLCKYCHRIVEFWKPYCFLVDRVVQLETGTRMKACSLYTVLDKTDDIEVAIMEFNEESPPKIIFFMFKENFKLISSLYNTKPKQLNGKNKNRKARVL